MRDFQDFKMSFSADELAFLASALRLCSGTQTGHEKLETLRNMTEGLENAEIRAAQIETILEQARKTEQETKLPPVWSGHFFETREVMGEFRFIGDIVAKHPTQDLPF